MGGSGVINYLINGLIYFLNVFLDIDKYYGENKSGLRDIVWVVRVIVFG